LYGGYPTEIAGSTQNPEKNWNESKRNEKKKKKMCREKDNLQNSFVGYPAEFSGSTQNLKKIIGTSNKLI
jgi:hypothetical protein